MTSACPIVGPIRLVGAGSDAVAAGAEKLGDGQGYAAMPAAK